MLSSILKDRISIQVKTSTPGPLGEEVVWSSVETRYARVIPLDVKTIAQYQQLNTQVTHKVVFRGAVTIDLGKHRLIYKGKAFVPIETAQELEGATIVVAREV